MYILKKRYPGSPVVWTKVFKREELYLDKSNNQYELTLIENSEDHWVKFPDLCIGDYIVWPGRIGLQLIESVSATGLRVNNTFINNENVIGYNIQKAGDDEIKLFFKEKLGKEGIYVGGKIITPKGTIELVDSIKVEGLNIYLVCNTQQYLADNCKAYEVDYSKIVNTLNSPYWCAVKKNDPKLFYLKVLDLISEMLNGDWIVDWKNPNQEKYYIVCTSNVLFEVVSLSPPFTQNLGVPCFRTIELAEEAINIINGNLKNIYVK